MKRWAYNKGFTLVELLIVVVVIAILAAITIVAYNGIQQRAYNASMLATAKQAYTLLLQYTSQTGSYPLTATNTEMCLTADNVCTSNLEMSVASSNATLISALSSYGTLPRSAPSSSARTGIVYYRYPSQTFETTADAAYVYFVLKGANQNCSIGTVANDARTAPWVGASTTGYSWVGGEWTGCYIYLGR